MARGKADRQLTVGKKLEIIEEADRTGMIAATAQKYGVKTGQIRDWKKNVDRLRATDPSRLVAASTVQRGHLVFNETYAQYWVGYNKFCSQHTSYEELKHALHVQQKDLYRDGLNIFGFPTSIDPTATHALEYPSCHDYYTSDAVKEVYHKDLTSMREQLSAFFEHKPFPTKYLYFVTKLEFYRPDPVNGVTGGSNPPVAAATTASAAMASTATATPTAPTTMSDPVANGSHAVESGKENTATQPGAEDAVAPDAEIHNYISVYVAICGNGSVMVPMSVFPPVEAWHWERKKPVKLRHAHSVHRTKRNDPTEALQFFSVTWKKYYDEEAKYSDKFIFLLDAAVEEFRSPEFTDGLKQLDGYDKYWTSLYTVRNPLRQSNFEDTLMTFVMDEWRRILTLKKSSQPNDYRKCIAFWFYTAWEFFAGDHARAAFRSCNMYLEDRAVWATVHSGTPGLPHDPITATMTDPVAPPSVPVTLVEAVPSATPAAEPVAAVVAAPVEPAPEHNIEMTTATEPEPESVVGSPNQAAAEPTSAHSNGDSGALAAVAHPHDDGALPDVSITSDGLTEKTEV